jgi:hypothetical protein
MNQHPHHLLQFFAYEHLRPDLQAVSKPFADAAHALDVALLEDLLASLPDNPETREAVHKVERAAIFFTWATRDAPQLPPLPPQVTAEEKRNWWRHQDPTRFRSRDIDLGLRFLLEAKDCAVRAQLYREPGETT